MIKSVLIILFLIIFFNANGKGSKNSYSLNHNDSIKGFRKEWTNFGLGIIEDRIDLGIDYNWHSKRFTYQVGYNASSTILSDQTKNYFNLGIGKSLINRRALLSATAGPGLFWGKNNFNENFSNSHFIKIGFQANVAMIVKVVKNFGFGLEFYGSMYTSQSTGGFRVVFHLNNFK